VIAASAAGYATYAASPVVLNRAAYAFPRADLFRYSAKWWSYLIPPVEHPLLGAAVLRFWQGVGIREALLEQQVGLGWGMVALALVGVAAWLRRGRESPLPPVARVPVLVVVAVTALVCSLSPERTIGTFTFVRPSAILYALAPMFRSYARFGLVVQLMTAMLAGIGVEWLRRAGSSRARVACIALVAFAAGEYVVSPAAQWRDVLPTAAHRWVMQQGDGIRVLDCTRLTPQAASVQWLTAGRVTLLGGPIPGCTDTALPQRLAANGYTHLLVRKDSLDRRAFAHEIAPDGFRLAARFDDAAVFTVSVEKPAIYTARVAGFFPPEHDAGWAWRWMGTHAVLTIVNTGERPVDATLQVEMAAFGRPRRMDVRLDGNPVQTLVIAPARQRYELGAIAIAPGTHDLAFHAAEAPSVADTIVRNGDPRALSFALGTWDWRVGSPHP
jgi:hypothetical protein